MVLYLLIIDCEIKEWRTFHGGSPFSLMPVCLNSIQSTLIDPLCATYITEPLFNSAIASFTDNAGANTFAHNPNAIIPRITITDFCSFTSWVMVLLVINTSIFLNFFSLFFKVKGLILIYTRVILKVVSKTKCECHRQSSDV